MEKPYCLAIVASRLRSEAYIDWIKHSLLPVAKDAYFMGIVDDGNLDEAIPRLRECRGLALVVATGGTEHIILSIRKNMEKPILVIAMPYANSLPAVMEAAPLLQRAGKTLVHYIDDFSYASLYSLKEALEALRVATQIGGSRLGVIGGVSPWLVYSRLGSEQAAKMGIKLVDISLDELIELYNSSKVPEKVVAEIASRAEGINVPIRNIEDALRVYDALRTLIERYRLDALTIKCFDLIFRLRTTACLPLALLNSNGFIAGCEGDIPSTITMMLLSRASRRPAFMANPAKIGKDYVIFAHCTAPLVYGSFKLMTHFESGIGVGVSVKYPIATPVTIARLDPERLSLRVFKGVIEASGLLSDKHCRTQLRVRITEPERLLQDSIGNHYVIVPGDHVTRLRYVAGLLGLGFEELGPRQGAG